MEMINVSARKTQMSTSKVSMFKLTIEEQFEYDQTLIKAKFKSLDITKSVYFFWDTLWNVEHIRDGTE